MTKKIITYAVSVLLTLSLVFLVTHSLAQQTPEMTDPLGVKSESEEMMFVIGGTLGLAEFCPAYGVDYRYLVGPVIEGFRRELEAKEDITDLLTFNLAIRLAERAWLYSPSVDRFINMVSTDADLSRVCRDKHQEAIMISKFK